VSPPPFCSHNYTRTFHSDKVAGSGRMAGPVIFVEAVTPKNGGARVNISVRDLAAETTRVRGHRVKFGIKAAGPRGGGGDDCSFTRAETISGGIKTVAIHGVGWSHELDRARGPQGHRIGTEGLLQWAQPRSPNGWCTATNGYTHGRWCGVFFRHEKETGFGKTTYIECVSRRGGGCSAGPDGTPGGLFQGKRG